MTPSSSGFLVNELLVLVTSVGMAAVILFLIIRRVLIHRTEKEVRRIGDALKTERQELERRADELEAFQTEIEVLKAKLADLATQKLMLSRRGRKRTTTSRRFIHEIGRAEPGRHCFPFTLSVAPGFAQRPEPKLVVHPAIWAFHNEAQVWASDFPAAQMLTRSVFHEGVGVTVGIAGEAEDRTATLYRGAAAS